MCLFLESCGFIIPWKYNDKNKQTCTLTASTKYIPNDRPKLRCTFMAHLWNSCVGHICLLWVSAFKIWQIIASDTTTLWWHSGSLLFLDVLWITKMVHHPRKQWLEIYSCHLCEWLLGLWGYLSFHVEISIEWKTACLYIDVFFSYCGRVPSLLFKLSCVSVFEGI